AVEGDDVALAGVSPADRAARPGADGQADAGLGIADRLRARDVRSDLVPLDRQTGSTIADDDAGGRAGDHVPRPGIASPDEVAVAGAESHGERAARQARRSGGVGPDEVALDDVVVAAARGDADPDPVELEVDDVAGPGIGAPDQISACSLDDGDSVPGGER